MAEIFGSQAPILFQRQIVFLFVMPATGANEIAYAIRSAARPRDDMIYVQDLIARTVVARIDESVVEFDQDVFA